MKRIITLTDEKLHSDVKIAAARWGLSMAEIVRRLLLALLRGEIELPGVEGGKRD